MISTMMIFIDGRSRPLHTRITCDAVGEDGHERRAERKVFHG